MFFRAEFALRVTVGTIVVLNHLSVEVSGLLDRAAAKGLVIPFLLVTLSELLLFLDLWVELNRLVFLQSQAVCWSWYQIGIG